MRITVVGSGNGGSAVAADLSLKGHCVTLLKTSYSINDDHFNAICNSGNSIRLIRDGVKETAQLENATRDFKEAFCDCQAVILFVQTNYHEEIIKKIVPYLTDQIVLLEPGYLGTLYFLKHRCSDKVTIAEAESSPIDCRITDNGEVTSIFENVRNPIAIYPRIRRLDAFKILEGLQYKFTMLDSIVESALHNPNLIVHTIGAFMSIPRIEYSKGDYWMYREVFTPTVWNIVRALDNEKMSILEKLNCKKTPYVEACKYRNSMDNDTDATEVFFDYAYNHSPKGPGVVDSRYITEDVSQGLVLMESIGKYLGVDTKVCTSIIDLSSAALGRDFRRNGRSIGKLGIELFEKIIR